jgi:hypothetical protein
MIHYIERRQRLPRIFPAEECVDSTSLSVGHRLRLIRPAGPERGRCPPTGGVTELAAVDRGGIATERIGVHGAAERT